MSERGRGHAAEADGPITVFLLDDHELVRRGVRDVLEADGDIRVVGQSGSALQAPDLIETLRPDVALLDGRLPDGSGIEVCRRLAESAPTVACVVLTSYDDDEPLLAAVRAGAAGYLLKQITGADLVEAVRTVAAGRSMVDPRLTARILEWVRSGETTAPTSPRLTATEEEILALLGDGLTNRQIAHRTGLAEKTVKNYVSIMLTKLGLESRTQAAILAVKRRTPSFAGPPG